MFRKKKTSVNSGIFTRLEAQVGEVPELEEACEIVELPPYYIFHLMN